MKLLCKNPMVLILAIFVVFIGIGVVGSGVAQAAPATAPTLGVARPYAVLGFSTVTCTGATTVNGDVGVSTGTSIIGFPSPCTVTPPSTTHSNDASAIAAQAAILTAYGQLAGQPVGDALNLAVNNTVTPGIYEVGATSLAGTTLTLDGPGIYLFRSSSSIVTSGAASVVLTNGAKAGDVYWQIPTSMNIGTGTVMVGTIIADTGTITLASGASLNGRALTKGTAVTLDANTITVPTSLTLNKVVINDDGGTALASAWTLSTTAPSPTIISGATGSVAVTNASVVPGAYTLSESGGPAGYLASTYSCVKNGGAAVSGNTITLAPGDVATCTITNDDIAPAVTSLTLNKVVINDNGGTALASAWTLSTIAPSPTIISGATGSAAVTGASVAPGVYTLSESGGSAGYLASTYSCVKNGGAPVLGNTITLAPGDVAICTITNNDIAPRLHLIKVIVGGTATLADFPLTANGTGANDITGISPVNSGAGLLADTWTLSETNVANYTASAWVCVGGTQVGSSITLGIDDEATCTITNTYAAPSGGGGYSPVIPVAPLISVVKVPSPLSLPSGSGAVTYTYTVKNIGTEAMGSVTVVDDTCSDLTLVSGDTNSDYRLDLEEIWTYTCSTTLTETHTNTVVATGWANGISATDIANATVVVGLPIIPPLINITKVPNPLTLPANGGMVTYTKTVTNPGTVPLSNVTVTDANCSPVTYISGDTNDDSMLDPAETWVYRCSINLTQTTTNTATASGQANGLTARDFALATVVVPGSVTPVTPIPPPVPSLPDTGFAPQNLGLSILTFIIVIASIFLLLTLRKRTN